MASWSAAASTLNYDDLLKAERDGVQMLGWSLMRVTSHSVLECLIQMGLISSEDQCTDCKAMDQPRVKRVIRDALELSEYATLDYELSNTMKPSEIALASVIAARSVNGVTTSYPEHYTFKMQS